MMMKECGCSKISCGCCAGVEPLTPQATANRPGLSEVQYRIGTHATFFETMQSRLSSFGFKDANDSSKKNNPLSNLTTRQTNDSSIAMLSGAATMLDVLTFYQERLANEGYLRTATERRSVLDLGRLVGYIPRPGVSASVYLAYTMDDNSEPAEIPKGALSQSVPAQDELPQSFETSEKLEARKEWNDLKPRSARPQSINAETSVVYFEGTETNLKTNDPLLFVIDGQSRVLQKVKSVEPMFQEKKTKVILQNSKADGDVKPKRLVKAGSTTGLSSFLGLATPLSLPVSKQPFDTHNLGRDPEKVFDNTQDTLPQILSAFNRNLASTGYKAWSNTTVTAPQTVEVHAFRTTAQLFGSSAPKRIKTPQTTQLPAVLAEPQIVDRDVQNGTGAAGSNTFLKHELDNAIDLDATYEKIVPDSWVVVDTSGVTKSKLVNFELVSPGLLITRSKNVSSISRADYGLTAKTTRLELGSKWIEFKKDLRPSEDPEFELVRRTVVHAQSEKLELADEPIGDDVCGEKIELGALYDGLRTGRWVIVAGERTDIPETTGIMASELVMLAGIEQNYDPKLPGDKIHTTLILANSLAYCYKRDTVKIYGNVVKATHGETRNEVLGSGDAAQSLQSFTLKQPPLTFVSASTTSGIESSLTVRVNDIRWDETDSLARLLPDDRKFVTKTEDDGKTIVIFGSGEKGARPATGVENIKSVYRNGIGKGGNVKAEQISLLMTKPLGVKEVINPQRASGGADKETRDQARRNVPVALMALDRLVSTSDYADYARTFAGVGKASASRLSDGHRRILHLTIAGADDIPIDPSSDLIINLRRALRKFGDPQLALKVVTRELIALVISAAVKIREEYLWESVVANIRTALLEKFSFERRELGQTVFLSELLSAIQSVEGVAYSDVDVLDGLSETVISNEDLLNAKLATLKVPNQWVRAELARKSKTGSTGDSILPAQIAFLMPDVPDTLILNQIQEVKK